MNEHKLTLVPQPIADSWQAKCSCGWKTTKSFWDISNKEELLTSLKHEYKCHVDKIKVLGT